MNDAWFYGYEGMRWEFLLHIVIEVPAALNFLLFPSRQLTIYSPQAHAVVRQYAVLLFTSVIISALFLFRIHDELSGQVAGALSLYHIGPSIRSVARLRTRLREGRGLFPSEPAFYLVLHMLAGAALSHSWWTS
jgi:hypothetical protein